MMNCTQLNCTRYSKPLSTLTLILALGLILGNLSSSQAENWTRFRGENGTGISQETAFPVKWKSSDYIWDVKLPGTGHSSPIIWEDHLFVTCSDNSGTKRQLVCLNSETGKLLWKKTIALKSMHLHKKNSFASGSPTTDGESVFVTFTDDNHILLAAYTMKGEEIWTKDFGEFQSQHGPGVSPIVYKNMIILPNDMMGPSHVFAVDKKTGDIIWKTKRKFRRTAYSTPMIYANANGQDEIICISGATGVTGLDPQTGKELWASGEMPMRTVASPVMGDGVVIALCGSGGSGKLMVAVEPGSKGNQTAKVRYERKKQLPYVATPVVYNGLLFIWADAGIVTCMDIKTGKELWMKRVGGKFSGSPVCVDGNIYCIGEGGTVVVIAAKDQFEELGRTELNETSYATPAISNGKMYLRTETHLYCLPSKNSKS